MACATDWDANLVYDRWVARTMSGQWAKLSVFRSVLFIYYVIWLADNCVCRPFYAQETLIKYINGGRLKRYFLPRPRPLPHDDYERKQFGNLDPFQVFSCWNGAAVIDPRAFFESSWDSKNSVTRYQSGNDNLGDQIEEGSQMLLDPQGPEPNAVIHPPEVDKSSAHIRFRTAHNDNSPITEKASECFLICVDLWRRGMNRILMVPRARFVLFSHRFMRLTDRLTAVSFLSYTNPATAWLTSWSITRKSARTGDALLHIL